MPAEATFIEDKATMTVRRIFSKSGNIIKEEEGRTEIELPRMDPEAPRCTVSMDKAMTRNLGNYNSFKVSAFISVPAYLDDEQIEAAFAYAQGRVDDAINMVLTEEKLNA